MIYYQFADGKVIADINNNPFPTISPTSNAHAIVNGIFKMLIDDCISKYGPIIAKFRIKMK